MKKKTEDTKKNEDIKKIEDPSKTSEQKQEKEKEKEKEKDKTKQEEKKEKSKPKKKKPITKFNIDYIFRREQYILKNQKLTLTFQEMKKLISQELNIEESNLIINYLEKEITTPKTKIYDLIKDNKIKFFEVKKKTIQAINESIKTYIYTIKINNIKEAYDFNKQIDIFFSDLCLEKDCISEPTSLESYNVSFSRSDLAFDFKKFLTILKKVNELYKDIEIDVDIPKSNIKSSLFDNNNDNKKYKKFKIASAEHYKRQLGDYFTWNDIKRIQSMEEREKWIDQKGFYNSAGPVKKK